MIRSLFGLAALASLGLLATGSLHASEIATATISGSQISPGEFQYSLTLNDTGTTTLGTFWFAWIPGDNFMPVSPTSITSPTGWKELVTSGGPSGGSAIQWTAKTPADDLGAGSSLSGFTFDSSLTLTQLEDPSSGHPADPVATSFVYSGTPFSDGGFKLVVAGASTASPEPSNFVLGAFGLGSLLVGLRRRILSPMRSV